MGDGREGAGEAWIGPLPRFGAAILACGLAGSGYCADGNAGTGQRLRIDASYTLPVPELSGLGGISARPSEIALLAAGDSSYRITRFRYGPGEAAPAIETVDTARLSAADAAAGPSQWEAVAVDGQERPCLLAEVSAEVRCLNKELSRFIAAFPLDVSELPDLAESWRADPNSRGEGMILLQRGHLLLLKEKRPALLVEFGPKGEAALGYGPDLFLKPGDAFRYPDRGSLVALKSWEFAAGLKRLASDASDMTVGPDGFVYLLSDQGAVVVRLEGSLKPEEAKVRHRAFWRLPGEIRKPEGLAIGADMHPWIAVDRQGAHHANLFRLSRLETP